MVPTAAMSDVRLKYLEYVGNAQDHKLAQLIPCAVMTSQT